MMKLDFEEALLRIRESRPLVHHITNYVTACDCANVVLGLGGSPVMADSPEEVVEMVSMASALVLNLGTLSRDRLEAMLRAGKEANRKGIPVLLDPVGAGATVFRSQAAKSLLEQITFAFIRGNESEIRSLLGLAGGPRGVDTRDSFTEPSTELAAKLARTYATTVGVTGAVDIVSDGRKTYRVRNGHPMLTTITGTGCMTTSLIGTFLGAHVSPLKSGLLGISLMAISGELTAESLTPEQGTGHFHSHLMDFLSRSVANDLRERLHLEEATNHD